MDYIARGLPRLAALAALVLTAPACIISHTTYELSPGPAGEVVPKRIVRGRGEALEFGTLATACPHGLKAVEVGYGFAEMFTPFFSNHNLKLTCLAKKGG